MRQLIQLPLPWDLYLMMTTTMTVAGLVAGRPVYGGPTVSTMSVAVSVTVSVAGVVGVVSSTGGLSSDVGVTVGAVSGMSVGGSASSVSGGMSVGSVSGVVSVSSVSGGLPVRSVADGGMSVRSVSAGSVSGGVSVRSVSGVVSVRSVGVLDSVSGVSVGVTAVSVRSVSSVGGVAVGSGVSDTVSAVSVGVSVAVSVSSLVGTVSVINKVNSTEVSDSVFTTMGVVAVTLVLGSWGTWLIVSIAVRADHERVGIIVVESIVSTFANKSALVAVTFTTLGGLLLAGCGQCYESGYNNQYPHLARITV